MNWRFKINWQLIHKRFVQVFSVLFSIAVLLLAFNVNAQDIDNSWNSTSTVQAYWQTYEETDTRENAFNVGLYLLGDYLESDTIGFGYNYTLVTLNNNADITEHLFYFTGRHAWFMDAFPGKLTLRLDAYRGEGVLAYRTNNPPTGMGKKFTSGGSNTTRETTTISVIQPIISYINYNKTFYLDLGYANSSYDQNPDANVSQLTPTLGFGWSQGYNWLQLRGYFISVDDTNGIWEDDTFQSLETMYTHWFAGTHVPQIDFMRLSVLSGKRVLTVDPDAASVHSTADEQIAGVAASIQWKLTKTMRLMAFVSANQYKNDFIADEYDSQLVYLNLQHDL